MHKLIMNDMRISLRFRKDNETDVKTWELLDKVAKERNASKNSIALELIRIGAAHIESSEDAVAEHIADMVSERIGKMLNETISRSEATVVTATELKKEYEPLPQADEPIILGEDALDFLSNF